MIVTIALASSYMADITTCVNRTFAMTGVGFSIGLGYVAATFASGYFIEWFGFEASILFAAVCSIIIIIVVGIFLRESLKSENRTASLNVFIQLRAALDFYVTRRSQGHRQRAGNLSYISVPSYSVHLDISGKQTLKYFISSGSHFVGIQ